MSWVPSNRQRELGSPFFPSAMDPDPPAHTHSQISAEVPLHRSPEAISSSISLVRRYLCKHGTKVVGLAGTWEALLRPSLPLKQGWESGGRGEQMASLAAPQ